MSILDKTLERNPELIEAAIGLHQNGLIPPSTQVIDLDAVALNSAVLTAAGEKHGLRVYAMTKQNGCNPHMTRVALDQGLHGVVAVESMQAFRIVRYGFPLGNVGHLSNVPKHQVRALVRTRPEFVTVYNHEAARRVSEAAKAEGIDQRLYVRVTNPDDGGPYPGMIGGWREDDCVDGIRALLDLPNVTVAGLTQHCAITYETERDPETARPSEAFFTTLRAKELLERELGLEDLHVNCAGNTNSVTFGMLAGYGATEVEPGMALTGSAPFHAWHDMPEKPAQAIVTEILHHWEGEAYSLGGVFAFVWSADPEVPLQCLVGRSFEQAKANRRQFEPRGVIDYHGIFTGGGMEVGDTVAVVQHPQHHVERGFTAAVSGISEGKPQVEGIFDTACTALDASFNPLPLEEVMESLERTGRRYAGLPQTSHAG
ncbi:MAG: hypothetical protein QOH58_1586 [Thermoleophilaceae bacterium]|jgi:predicted amino acid racemase|nr:hypothetical protein [Thermoleophilaceae bacterium]